jgi:hypothetical protein
VSWDVSLYVEVDGNRVSLPDTWFNYTHNTNKMIRKAGFDEWPYDVGGWSARKLAAKLEATLTALRADPSTYRAMNPSNGWGDYDSLLEMLEKVKEVCWRYPSAMVSMSA